MRIGIAILNWNGINLLKSHLKGVVDKSGDSTIYIIDNNSDDNSLEFVEQNFPQVKLISLDKNYGFAEGYNIKTSAFQVSGIQQDVYLSDLPNRDRKSGSLFLFTLPSENSRSPAIIRRNVGRVDYVRGIITINPINILSGKIKDGQTIIEISISPKSNDVIGLQDLYLQLDTSKCNYETIVDEISSKFLPI